MSAVFTAVAVAGLASTAVQASAAEDAEDAQHAANQASLAENQRAREEQQDILAPYVAEGIPAIERMSIYEESGAPALGALGQYVESAAPALAAQQGFAGLGGQEQQQEIVKNIIDSEIYKGMVGQGEEAILQNASATGGLRGGNVQGALSDLRANALRSIYNDQALRTSDIANRGANIAGQVATNAQNATQNVASIGQASAAQDAASVGQAATNSINLLTNQGAQAAGQKLAQGQLYGNAIGTIGGVYAGMQNPSVGKMLFGGYGI